MRFVKRLFPLSICLALLACLTSCGPSPFSTAREGETYVSFFDVGQADCALVRTQDSVILVDTGDGDAAKTARIVRSLRRAGIRTIDCLVLTHPHTDHIGGAVTILSEFEVRECLMPNSTSESSVFTSLLAALAQERCAVREAYRGRTVKYGSILLEILAPSLYSAETENSDCVVFRLVSQELRILFASDAEAANEEELLALYEKELRADILKVGHHGSYTSTTEAFLLAVSPSYAVISCAQGDTYESPHISVLERLQAAGVATLRTDLEGTVSFYVLRGVIEPLT